MRGQGKVKEVDSWIYGEDGKIELLGVKVPSSHHSGADISAIFPTNINQSS